MYQPDERDRGWRHLGGQDETYQDLGFGDEEPVSFELLQNSPNDLENTYTDKGSLNNMTKQEELQLIAEAQAGSKSALACILKKYELLCHKLSRKFGFTSPNADHDDLFQEAQIGLISAVSSYDKSKGASFMTWAFYAVRGAIVSSGKSDRKQPRYPVSLETSQRAYNVEDDRVYTVKDDLPENLVYKLIEDCCGGFHTKRAKIVCDRYGLFGNEELRNCETAAKYGISKNAVVSHTYNFKLKVRAKFPELAQFV